jgi:hypothetical protein
VVSTDRIPNPYTYTDFSGGELRHRAQAEEIAKQPAPGN